MRPTVEPARPARRDLPSAPPHRPRGTPRPSRRTRWRALSLVLVHVAVLVHLAHWKVSGETLTPLEPSEAMQTLELGWVNAGFVLLGVSVLATLVLGRFFCGWLCHVVAYQDLCAWLLGKLGLRPRPIRSRLLALVPLGAALYMFAWPQVERLFAWQPPPTWSARFSTRDFWGTFPGPAVAALTILVDGFLIVWLLGAKGFCTYGCPYGAIFAIAERGSRGRIRVTDACEGCGHCTATCTSNVRVHEEVARFGQVVDPGCMKCMDCVNVCPKGALYFGFGPSRRSALSRARRPRRVYDFTWGEELALAAVFLASFYALRDLYDRVPLLLAIGLSVIAAAAALLAWRLLRRGDLRFQHAQLRAEGKLKPAGWAALVASVLGLALVGHSFAVQYHAGAGERLLLRAGELRRTERGALLEASLGHLLSARSLGLLPVGELELQIGSILREQGDRAAAEVSFRRAIELESDLRAPRLALADLLILRGESAEAERLLRELLAIDPENGAARARLERLEQGILPSASPGSTTEAGPDEP